MPRVPTRDTAAVVQEGARPAYQNADFNDGTRELNKGIGELGQAVGNVQELNDLRAKKAKARADAIAADSLFTQAQQFTTEQLHGYDEKPQPTPGPAGGATLTDADIAGVGEPGAHVAGYLDSRGTDAHAKSGDTFGAIQKKYEDLLKLAGNEDQRNIVRERLGTLAESVRAQIAEHEGQQFKVADQAATAGLKTTTLNSAAVLYNRPADVAKLTEDTLASIKRSSLPEEYEAKKQEYLAQVSQTMIDGYLQHGDVSGALVQYGRDEKQLGTDGEHVKAKIDAAAHAQLQQGKDIEGATAAKLAFDGAVDQKKGVGRADGVGAYAAVDEKKARAHIETLAEGPVKVAATHFLEHRLDVAEKEKANAVHAVYQSALSAIEKSGGTLAAVSAEDRTWLQNKDNKLNEEDAWEKLVNVAHGYAERARAHSRAHAEHETPAQAQALVELEADIAKNPEVYKGMSKEQFDYQWADRLSVGGYKSGGAKYATAQKDNPEKAAEFSRYVKDSIVQSPGLAVSKVKAALYAAEMGRLRQEYVSDSKGKEPDAEARKKMEASATVTALLWKPGTPSRPVDIASPTSSNFLRPPAEKAAAPKKVRIRNTAGRLGWWDGVSPLPEGATVVTGG